MKWLRSALLVGLLVAVATLSARAQDKDKAPAIKQTAYYPLLPGTAWTYKLGDTKFKMTVTKFEPIGDTLCARVEMSVDGKVQAFEHVAVKDDGVYRYTFEGKKAEPPIRFLKLPPKKGETWEVNSKVGGENLKGTFKAGEEDVKVPAGAYKTVTAATDDLDANGTKISFKNYFAENVGMVKQDLDIAGQKAVIELEKYEPGKGPPTAPAPKEEKKEEKKEDKKDKAEKK